MNDVITSISPARPERISLDFERLRAEGIRRLEEWAPFIWTDFNAHDPGITILEALCYAITDLAYRTHLPLEDLLASGSSGLDTKQFFRAEEILPTCPVTENDFRKVIIDIPGVKNAWLEKAGLQEPRICIRREERIRPISASLVERLNSLFGEDSSAMDITAFEQVLIDIGETEEIPVESKNLLRDIFLRFVNDPNDTASEDIASIRQISAAQSNEAIAEDLEVLAERLENFLWYFRCTNTYHVLAFKSAGGSTAATFDEAVGELAHLKEEVQQLVDKLKEQSEPGFDIEDLRQLWDYVDYLSLNHPDDARLVFQLAKEILCKLSFYEIRQLEEGEAPPDNFELLHYNGLYKVKLDLHDSTIEPGTKAAKQLIKTVVDKLHEYRNLCEDYVGASLVETQFLCLCLDVEVTPEADEQEVMAEIMFRLQEFLTPTIRFFSLQQMLERGLTGDQILTGPLLDHGFIPDEELERGEIPEKVFISDLYRVILDVPGVLQVNELAIKRDEEEDYIRELSCLDMEGKKPVIDICCSCLYATREGFTIRILEKDLQDLLDLKALESRNLVGDPQASLPSPKGTYREDLAAFTSVQEEFPENYAVGLNGPPPNASPERLAQIQQLQAYLTFYDRLMANYLQQLSHVKNLFAVEQDPRQSTYFFDALYHIPGIKALIFQPATLGTEQIDQLRDELPPEAIGLLEGSGLIGEPFSAFGAWNQAMEDVLGHYWSDQAEIRMAVTRAIKQGYSEEEWQAFVTDDDNYYLQRLQEIIEPSHHQQLRKNQLMNHLLARFGEQFTHFSLQQFGVSQEVSLFDNYQDYLQAKADFLWNIPVLGSERAKAYNYRKFIYGPDVAESEPQSGGSMPVRPDVWNTENVAGLKKRIYRLLNMGAATTESVFCDPEYRIDLEEDETANRPRYFIQLVELDKENRVKRVLLTSPKAYSRNQARARQQNLREKISRQDWVKVVPSDIDTSSFRVRFTFEDGTDTTVLQSDELNSTQSKNLQEHIIGLVDTETCNKEGFHLVEHILLRPLVKEDALLEHSFTCDAQMAPLDPYSFWLTILLPGWTRRFKDPAYRRYFEQVVRRETPAHIALCFRWLEEEDQITMKQLEDALEQWREAKADCDPDACDVSEQAEQFLHILNRLPCACYCPAAERPDLLCDCEGEQEEPPVG